MLALSFVLLLIGYACVGLYSRYMADDYTAVIAAKQGWVHAQIATYRGWTGRFSFSFVANLLALTGAATPPFIPGLLLTLWLAVSVWAMFELQSLSGKISWERIVLYAGFVIVATLATAPNLAQSLYWQTGSLTYLAPFIPLSLFVGVICRGARTRHSKFTLLATAILAFLAGGFSDVYVVLQSCGLILSIMMVEIFGRQDFKSRFRIFLITGLVGSLLALIIVAVAPGNSIRLTYFPQRLGGLGILELAIFYSVGFIAKQVIMHPLIFLGSLVLSLASVIKDFSLGREQTWDRRLCMWILVIVPAAVFLIIMCCIALGVYAMSVMLPERARILLSFLLVCGTLIWGRAAAEHLVERLLTQREKIRKLTFVANVAAFLLIAFPLTSFFSIVRIREQARNFALDWDRQDSQLKAAKKNGIEDVTVPQIGDFQSRIGKGASDLHLRTDPSFWINRTVARYYGLRSVRANEDVAGSR